MLDSITSFLKDKFTPVKGAAFIFTLFITSFLGSLFILVPILPVLFVNHALWRKLADRLIGFWLSLPVAMLHFLYGIRFHVSGDKIDRNEPAIIIMNHRTRLDWLFFWSALYKIDPWLLTTEKISLKRDLKMIPGANWAMETNAFIFLDRKWDSDQKVLSDFIEYYKISGGTYQILIFPEGTDKCNKATGRSHSYADLHGLEKYDYVLHPRTTGFTFLLQEMIKQKYITRIYDCTIGYADKIVQSEPDLVKSGPPLDIHVHVEAFDIDSIPPDNNEKRQSIWLCEQWAKKEKLLKAFYTPANPEDRKFDFEKRLPVDYPRNQNFGLIVSALFWILTSAMWLYFFVSIQSMRLYYLFAICLYCGIEYKYGGVERWIIRRN